MTTHAVARNLPAFVVTNPAISYTTAATTLAFFALTPTPSFIPIVALLTTLRLSAWTFVSRRNGFLKGGIQAALISIAAGAAHLAPSMQALSTPNVALAVFSAISLVASSFAVLIVFASAYISKSFHDTWAKLLIFPAFWATAWGFMSKVSPVGQLVTWSPVLGLGAYGWTRQVLGQWGIDWAAAAWAVVASEVLGDFMVGASNNSVTLIEEEPRLIDHEETPHSQLSSPASHSSSRSINLFTLSTLLVLVMTPTYFTTYLPAPTNADSTTPFSIACALPDSRTIRDGNPTLDDYILATKQLQSQATVIFWPEGAVRFDTADARNKAFDKIQNVTNGHKLVGVSFEEFVPAEGKRRNGFALLGNSGPPVFEYYKRNLVPIAESFSLTPGHDAPGIYDLELVTKPLKGRTIPLSASICLDFASSSSFTSFDSRPALILAPARTWHIGVGYAMWEQAKARAAETGSTVIWCDGGAGGISGIANGAYSEIVQVGPGSWVRQLGIPYPFDGKRTWFGWGGDATAFCIVWATLGLGPLAYAVVIGLQRGRAGIAGLVGPAAMYARAVRGVLPGRKRAIGPSIDEQTSLLG